MKKLILPSIIILLTLVVLVSAMKPNFVTTTNTKSHSNQLLIIPEHAQELAPNVFSLGQAIDSSGKIVEGIAIIHPKDKTLPAKPGTECGNLICEQGENAKKCPIDCSGGGDPNPSDTSSCYGFLAKDAKWKTIEPYLVDTSNNAGLSSSDIKNTLASGIQVWENAAGKDILGNEIPGIVDRPNIGNLNNKNEVIFADLTNSNTIGVTIVWGIFSGPPFNRELVEWDAVYNDGDFNWSADCTIDNCTSKMDLPNIIYHELGHSFGLDDLYDSLCSEMTMFGLASFGDTNSRTLEDGDINGIKKLYA
jgi:hypothetical protein